MPTVSMIHEKRNSSATDNKEHYNMHCKHTYGNNPWPQFWQRVLWSNYLGYPSGSANGLCLYDNSHGQRAPWFWVEKTTITGQNRRGWRTPRGLVRTKINPPQSFLVDRHEDFHLSGHSFFPALEKNLEGHSALRGLSDFYLRLCK